MSTSTSNKFLIIISVIALFLLITYFTTDLIQQAKNQFEVKFLNKKIDQITYYQWTDQNGKMIISENKPSNNQNYITFQGSKNLVSNENKIDLELISQGNQYRKTLKEEGEEQISARKSNLTAFPKDSPLNAINKTKTCVNLSVQMRDASLTGDMKAHSKLREAHQKLCQ